MSNPFRESILREIQSEVRRSNRSSIGLILNYDVQSGLADVRYEDILDEDGDVTTHGILMDIPVMIANRDTEDLTGRVCVVNSITGDTQNWCVTAVYPKSETFATGTTYASPTNVMVGPQVYDGSPLVLKDLTASGMISQDAANNYAASF